VVGRSAVEGRPPKIVLDEEEPKQARLVDADPLALVPPLVVELQQQLRSFNEQNKSRMMQKPHQGTIHKKKETDGRFEAVLPCSNAALSSR